MSENPSEYRDPPPPLGDYQVVQISDLKLTEQPSDLMARAEALNTAVREMSDLLKGAVAVLVEEGWTDEQARALVLATFLLGDQS